MSTKVAARCRRRNVKRAQPSFWRRRASPTCDDFHTTPLDAPARRLADAVGVEPDRKDHRRVISGSTAAIGTVGSEELGEIELAHHVEDEPRQMPFR
jgi:hypothetical protein